MIKNKFYVTTPLYYVTAEPHLGTLYSTLLADVAARWNKLQGKRVFFLTGTDEHGQKIAQAAQKAGKDPKAFVDSYIDVYKDTWRAYQIEYDRFIRTTDISHVEAVQQWIQVLQKKGDIYKSFYEGWYCTPCETFVAEKILGVEKGPLCPECGRATAAIAEETYFFRLSAYQDRLLKFYEKNPRYIVPKERLHEVINFVKSGLRDLSISRTKVTWGIPFPGDEKHVVYVWADALNNYISAVGYGQPDKQDMFNFWWPADLQIMAKDIVRFHAIYWPAFLMAADLAMPHQLLVHGWIKVDHKKMSKSLGNVVDPRVLHEKYGADQVRYYLVRYLAINQDSEFSITDLEQRVATDLANDLGNLLNRMVSLAEKHGIETITAPQIWSGNARHIHDQAVMLVTEFQEFMHEWQFHLALARLWKFINDVNSYFHASEPWKLAKTDKVRFIEVLSCTCHTLHVVAVLLWPVMPEKMEELLRSIGIVFELSDSNKLEELVPDLCEMQFVLKKIPPLFVRPEEMNVIQHEEKKVQGKDTNTVTIDEFARMQLVVGTIEACEELPKSDRLLKLTVNFGEKGKRIILAGVKKWYQPEELIGKQSVFVFNLEPRRMMGLESQGMMLMAEDAEGKPQRVTVAGPVINGVRLR